ncbi:MAG: tyrosinase family protein [Azospirillaceae bacterium]|nr:tyrosinase family protein [Azospirillaceae bacterium]
MMEFSRRAVIAGGAAGLGVGLLSGGGHRARAATPPRVRSSAHSKEGKEMLGIYAGAVKTMMEWDQKWKGDPRSWQFQWYTHSLPGADKLGPDVARQQAINEVYGAGATVPHAILAGEMWATCQPHYSTRNDDFLPWHRMYVWYFEAIIASVSGEPAFALPYWDYTNPDAQTLPEEFRRPSSVDPKFGALFRETRNSWVNLGQSITTGGTVKHPPAALNLNSMNEPDYSGNYGFCKLLESGLHGSVHDFTGNETGMGAVTTAAGDPIFWLHHCNVDRVWAGWNKAGGQNPSDPAWEARTYVFVNGEGDRVTPRIGDVLDIASLGYAYDVLPVPPKPQSLVAGTPRRLTGITLATASLATTSLNDTRIIVNLDRPADSKNTSFMERLKDMGSGVKLYVSFRGLSVHGATDANIDVYLNKRYDTGTDDAHFVDNVGFFGTEGHGHAGHEGMAEQEASFEVTELMATLAQLGLNEEPTLVLVPSGTDTGDPRIESVDLVAR